MACRGGLFRRLFLWKPNRERCRRGAEKEAEMKSKTKKRHPWQVYLVRAVCGLAAAAALLLLGVRLYFRLPVGAYYRASERGFLIPDCGDNFVAQGLDYDEDRDRFLVTGYQKDGIASPIYLVAPGAREAEKTVRMYLPDGSLYTGHAGGIAQNGDFVYVADGERRRLLVFAYQDILDAPDGAGVAAAGTFSTAVSDTDYIGPAFVAVDGDKLVVGEFYREPEYPTPDSHKVSTQAGDYQQALAVVYQLDGQAEYGIAPVPVMACSLPDAAQGMCFDKGSAYVSTSWGASFSRIYRYDMDRLEPQETIALLGMELPLYAMDSAALTAVGKLPPMSEEIVIVDGRMYTMCESASNKYIFGKFTSAEWCYATDVEAFFD